MLVEYIRGKDGELAPRTMWDRRVVPPTRLARISAEAGGAAPALDRPVWAMVALLIALFANAVAMASPFPFAPFLVLHYGLTDDRAEIGYYGGFILSAFMLGRAMSSYHLGLLSDKHGRVLVIEIGLLSCITFQLLFGLSPTFGAALAARLLMGLFNGIIGVAKAAHSMRRPTIS